MASGEGKTLVATAPIYLNALSGRGVHLITVNDYLARRDAEWMGQLYAFLGLSIGIIQHDQPPDIRRAQYECDITYGTNSEFGFDYLRDNGMATSRDQQVQRSHYYAIVDEVDSILVDEARTPLIISGPATVSTHQYDRFKPLVEQLVRKQTMLCNRLSTEAKEFFDAGRKDEAGRVLFKLKLGQPRNKGLSRMMEDPEQRKLIDKAELEFYKDTDGKAALVDLKEELFFTIEERQHDADLTQNGRDFLNPMILMPSCCRTCLPSLPTLITSRVSAMRKRRSRSRPGSNIATLRPSGSTTFRSSSRLTASMKKTSNTWSKTTRSSSSIRLPAVRCRAVDGAMGFIRPSRQRKAFRSIAKPRRSRQSLFKITFGFTRSWQE
jgi:hypothetical protein